MLMKAQKYSTSDLREDLDGALATVMVALAEYSDLALGNDMGTKLLAESEPFRGTVDELATKLGQPEMNHNELREFGSLLRSMVPALALKGIAVRFKRVRGKRIVEIGRMVSR